MSNPMVATTKRKPTAQPDIRSRRFVFVPFCLLCQAFQAKGIAKRYAANIGPVARLLLDRDVNIIQMPCPESGLGGYARGLGREPRSYDGYDTARFRKHCDRLAREVAEMAEGMAANGAPEVRNGMLKVPASPGLGLEMNPDFLKKNLAPGEEYWG